MHYQIPPVWLWASAHVVVLSMIVVSGPDLVWRLAASHTWNTPRQYPTCLCVFWPFQTWIPNLFSPQPRGNTHFGWLLIDSLILVIPRERRQHWSAVWSFKSNYRSRPPHEIIQIYAIWTSSSMSWCRNDKIWFLRAYSCIVIKHNENSGSTVSNSNVAGKTTRGAFTLRYQATVITRS